MAATTTTAGAAAAAQSGAVPARLQLLRVLGPAHVWGLGVGIVLVGEHRLEFPSAKAE
jgi:ethanolamine permease